MIQDCLLQSHRSMDPAVETALDVEWFEKTFAEVADVYRNIYLNDHVFLRVAVVSQDGLYAIVPFEGKADASVGCEIRLLLGVDGTNSVIVFHSEEISLVLSEDGTKFTPVADIYGFFHEKLYRCQDEKTRVLDTESVFRLQARLGILEDGDWPVSDADEMIDGDGLLYVRRHVPVMLGSFDTGLGGRMQWYSVADDDTDRLVTMAAFGGWFGLHRFAQGEIAAGLLYLLSCGCVGILPALDIVMYLTGSMYVNSYEYLDDGGLSRVRMRQYLRKPTHKIWAVVCVFLAVGAGILSWRLLYQGAFPGILQWIFRAVQGNMPTELVYSQIGIG